MNEPVLYARFTIHFRNVRNHQPQVLPPRS